LKSVFAPGKPGHKETTVNTWKRFLTQGTVLVGFVALLGVASNPLAPGRALAQGKKGANPAMRADMEVFHYLLDNRKDIKRTVKNLADGVETVTESDRAEVAKKIQEHAAAMHKRVKEGQGIHLRDPLFAEIFKNYDKVSMTIEKIEKGVKVKETSTVPRVAKLIQAHAAVVTKFIANGHEEVRRNHPVPDQKP
jgi:uncharacterized protein YdcH (DUF465 family)